jgi:hypothetical protein
MASIYDNIVLGTPIALILTFSIKNKIAKQDSCHDPAF